MLSPENNELLTRTAAGTPMGETLRRYWLPALLSEELPAPDCPPVRVKLLHEPLIAFRDSAGRVGLLDEHCAHRRASLFFGRNEEGGLRCVYHGWKYDVIGRCLEMPNEPLTSRFKEKIRLKAYPVEERSGVVWAYLGPADRKPPLVNLAWMRAPEEARHVSKTWQESNYLQGLEGGLDTSHVGFLHRTLNDPRFGPGSFWTKDLQPKVEVIPTNYGFTYAGIRDLGEQGLFVRLYHFVMPFYQIRPYSGYVEGRPLVQGHMWVPIDDENAMVYNWTYTRDLGTLTEEEVKREGSETGRAPEDLLPGYRLRRNRANDFEIDRNMQRDDNYTGIVGANTQDIAVQVSMGSIVDRSSERLASRDLAIIRARKLLLGAVKDVQGARDPLGWDGGGSERVQAAEGVLARDAVWYESLKEEALAIA